MTGRRRWSGARNRLECCPAGRAGSLAQDPRAGELVCPGAVSAWAGDDDLKRARGRLAQPEVGDGRAVILERLFDECGEVRTVRGARVAAWHEGHRVGLRQVRHRAGRLGGRDSTTAVPRRVTFARALDRVGVMREDLAARVAVVSLNTRGIALAGSRLAERYAAIGAALDAGDADVWHDLPGLR